MTEKLLISSKEVAELLDMSEETLRRSRVKGKETLLGVPAPKHIKFGRTVKYRYSDVMEWIETIAESNKTYQFREVGESKWQRCTLDWYLRCESTPIYETKPV